MKTIAQELVKVAKQVVAESKGTVEFIRNSAYCRKMIGEITLENFIFSAKDCEKNFLTDLRLAVEEATMSAVNPKDITHSYSVVASYQNTPGIQITANITMVPEETKWNILQNLKAKGYRIK